MTEKELFIYKKKRGCLEYFNFQNQPPTINLFYKVYKNKILISINMFNKNDSSIKVLTDIKTQEDMERLQEAFEEMQHVVKKVFEIK